MLACALPAVVGAVWLVGGWMFGVGSVCTAPWPAVLSRLPCRCSSEGLQVNAHGDVVIGDTAYVQTRAHRRVAAAPESSIPATPTR